MMKNNSNLISTSDDISLINYAIKIPSYLCDSSNQIITILRWKFDLLPAEIIEIECEGITEKDFLLKIPTCLKSDDNRVFNIVEFFFDSNIKNVIKLKLTVAKKNDEKTA